MEEEKTIDEEITQALEETKRQNDKNDVLEPEKLPEELRENPSLEDEEKIIVEIDDVEDDNEVLERDIIRTAKADSKKNKDTAKKVLRYAAMAILALFVTFAIIAVMEIAVERATRPKDDTEFETDNPEDPNSFTNVAKKLDENITPLVGFTILGEYEAYEEKDVYSDYRFYFDATGYFEGYSSASKDDFGKWEVDSTGDDYILHVICTEAEDSYKIKYLDDGKIYLEGKTGNFTLSPKS